MGKNIPAAAAIAVIMMCGCANTNNTSEEVKEYSKTIYAMDTVMNIKAYSEDYEVLDKAEDEIKRIEALLTRGSKNSEIYKINHSEETTVSEETAEILRTALEIGYDTDGAFDVSIAPVMDLWEFYSQDFYVPSDDELAAALERVDYSRAELDGTTVKTPLDMSLDLGGIAKGYTSDRVMEVLSDSGVESAVISLGGNVQTLGNKPDGSEWNVAIIDPFNQDEYIGGVKNTDKAVITSGGYQR
ncbi:MAG: FAD:protein FMN transferase, partial [Oscillospiraceae bacterium]|nr:FAD:protein FMN transferase [Oscillospiraceae bacterium]